MHSDVYLVLGEGLIVTVRGRSDHDNSRMSPGALSPCDAVLVSRAYILKICSSLPFDLISLYCLKLNSLTFIINQLGA